MNHKWKSAITVLIVEPSFYHQVNFELDYVFDVQELLCASRMKRWPLCAH